MEENKSIIDSIKGYKVKKKIREIELLKLEIEKAKLEKQLKDVRDGNN